MAKPSLSELRAIVAAGPPYEETFLHLLRSDSRSGARRLYDACMKKSEQANRARSHIEEMLELEHETRRNGFERIAGIDEAGRGPLAGPIVAAAVVLSEPLPGLDDSKKLTPEERHELFVRLHGGSHSIGVQVLGPDVIDQYGIQVANYSVMVKAAGKLDPPPDFLLVDGFRIPGCRFPHEGIVKGDARSQSIAAASIVAKVVRDRIMGELDRLYPQYGFARHKGYATEEHLAAIEKYGACPVHRRSFAPFTRQPVTDLLFEPEADTFRGNASNGG